MYNLCMNEKEWFTTITARIALNMSVTIKRRLTIHFYQSSKDYKIFLIKNSVSDDEYHRYSFSFFLDSTSLLETFLLASSFALCSLRLRFMSYFRERMLSTIPFFLFVSFSYICMCVLFGWSQSFPFLFFL